MSDKKPKRSKYDAAELFAAGVLHAMFPGRGFGSFDDAEQLFLDGYKHGRNLRDGYHEALNQSLAANNFESMGVIVLCDQSTTHQPRNLWTSKDYET